MHIDIIETLPSLAKIEDNWNAVYDADDEAQIFLSWRWLSGWLSYIEGPWFILAAKAGEAADLPYVAFLPLRLQTTIEKADVISDMRMAGNFGADYTGIICRPEAENKVIPAFARCIRQMKWARLNLENVRMSERRARLLLACFPKASFSSREVGRVNKVDGIDNSLCPYLTLPKDWNGYLELAERQYQAENPAPPEAGRYARRVSNNRFNARDVRAGPQHLAGILGHEVASPQG